MFYDYSNIWDIIKSQKDLAVYAPKSGTLLNELLAKNNGKTLADIQQKLRAGLISGDSYTKVAREIRGVMGNSVNNSLRIAVTEGHRNMAAGNFAMTEIAKDAGIDAKRKIVSVLDTRTIEAN